MKKILLIFLLSNSFAQDKPKSNFKEFDVEVLNNSLICKTISDDNFIDLDTFHINVGKKISLKGKNYYHFYFGLKDSLEGYIRHENGIIYYLPLNFLNESVLFDFNHKLKKNLVRNFLFQSKRGANSKVFTDCNGDKPERGRAILEISCTQKFLHPT